jgi:hypothetical protein
MLPIVASTDPWKLVKPVFDRFNIATFIDETRTLLWACPIRLFTEVSNTSSTLELYLQARLVAYPWSFKLCNKMYHPQFLFWKAPFDKIAYKNGIMLPIVASTDPWKLVKPVFDRFDIATFIDEIRTSYGPVP